MSFRPRCLSINRQVYRNALDLFHLIIRNRHRWPSRQWMAFRWARSDSRCSWRSPRMHPSLTREFWEGEKEYWESGNVLIAIKPINQSINNNNITNNCNHWRRRRRWWSRWRSGTTRTNTTTTTTTTIAKRATRNVYFFYTKLSSGVVRMKSLDRVKRARV